MIVMGFIVTDVSSINNKNISSIVIVVTLLRHFCDYKRDCDHAIVITIFFFLLLLVVVAAVVALYDCCYQCHCDYYQH